jgi:hypothetical protein
MNEEKSVKDFAAKFSMLTESNKKYVVAIQQALIYAQDVERDVKKKQCEKVS